MKLEELIYQKIIKSDVKSQLATYGNAPAIFYSEVPADNQEGWGKEQYPRICYWMDMQANQERNSVGVLTISLMCLNTHEQLPEQIEPIVKHCMKDSMLTPTSGQSSYCFAWAKTDGFSYQRQDGTRLSDGDMVIGVEISFDILEYTCQETTNPDPIIALNRYIKEQYKNALLLGYDTVDETIKATDDIPVFYSRLQELSLERETNTVAWFQGRIAIHLFCPNNNIKMKMLKGLIQRLGIDGEIIMLDNSPMFLEECSVNYKADYLQEGQIKIVVKYGVLRYGEEKKKMKSIEMKGGF